MLSPAALRYAWSWTAVAVLCCTFAAGWTPNEQALLQFAEQLTNFDDVFLHNNWTGWGRDSNALCPSPQTDVVDSTLCQPDFVGGINASSQSWTGIVCTPNDTVLCISLPSWDLAGNASALGTLASLQDLGVLNLANNSLEGTLPPSLPGDILNASALSTIALGYVYLSNNSISGALPALWGDSAQGWQQWLQGLYLDQNQLTGQLPHSWSDSNSLSNLGRLDLFLNQLSGPLTWNGSNMPGLGNLVLLPGNDLCGPVPINLDGVVRSYSTTIDGSQILPNVTEFGRACPSDNKHTLSSGAIAGGAIAAVAGALLVAFLCYICCYQIVSGSSKNKHVRQGPWWRWSLRAKDAHADLPDAQQPAFTASKLEPLRSSSSGINLLSNQPLSHIQMAPSSPARHLSTSAV